MASELAKIVVAAGVSLAAGLAIGGIGPRAEVRALQTRLEAIQEVDCGPSGLPAELAGVLQGRPWEGDRPAPSPRPAPTPEPEPEPEPDEPAGDGGAEVVLGGDGEPIVLSEGEKQEIADNLDAAREAIDIRNRQAWRALEEQIDPSPEQRELIQGAVDDMNAQLVTVAEALVSSVQDGRPPERRDMMVFAADALEAMIATEDTIYESLSPEQRARVDDEVLDPTSYLDASVIDVLQAIEEL